MPAFSRAFAIPLLFLALSAPALQAAAADPDEVYVSRVSGSILGEEFDVRVTLTLMSGNRFSLRIEATDEDGTDVETVRGTYSRSSGSLRIRTDDGDDELRFFVRGDRLVADLPWGASVVFQFLNLDGWYLRRVA